MGRCLEAPDGHVFNGIQPCLVLIESSVPILNDGMHHIALQGVGEL